MQGPEGAQQSNRYQGSDGFKRTRTRIHIHTTPARLQTVMLRHSPVACCQSLQHWHVCCRKISIRDAFTYCNQGLDGLQVSAHTHHTTA